MATLRKTWVVVADGAHAHLYVPDKDATALESRALDGVESAALHRHASDVASDKPGRAFSSASGGPRHAIEPHHDHHKMEKHNFAAALAKALEHASGAGQFEHLILIAPRRTVGELRTLLSESVKAKIVRTIQKDLVKASISELWLQVGPIVCRPPLAQAG
jgi:protein required for attachment to host cells